MQFYNHESFPECLYQLIVPPATLHPLTPPLQPNSRLIYWDMSPLRSTYSMRTCLLLSHPDVNSWLLTFGFQLHNVIPGYPKPDMDAMEPSYELIHTQMKTQEWDNSKVIYTHSCLPLGHSDIIGVGPMKLFRKAWAPDRDRCGASTVPARNCAADTLPLASHCGRAGTAHRPT